jgi:glycosyltransferase involved in cell wall biosynthesis
MPAGLQDNLNVLHIIDTLGMGGAETWLMESLRLWHRKGSHGIQMDFLATSGNRGIFDDEAVSLGAKIFYLRYGRSNALTFARGFREILRNGHYSAIHDHQGYASGWHFAMGAGMLPRVRVTHIHSAVRRFETENFVGQFGKWLVGRYSTHIAGTSRRVLEDYGFDDPNFSHIPRMALYCGFDPSRFLGDRAPAKADLCRELDWPENAKIILCVGRIDPQADPGNRRAQKNSAFAVSVGIECGRRDPNVRMLFAGELSPAVPVLEKRIAAAGLEGRIRFLGIRQAIERFLLASDVLLFPSRAEGLGMVAVEAQAAGLPVLASTNVPSECVVVPELVRFKDVDEGATAWADDLFQLTQQPRNIRCANQQVASSHFAIENSAEAVIEIYRSRPKVLQVVDTLGMGGAETWLMELLRAWSRQGENRPQMDFLVTSGNRGVFDDEATALGARIFYLRYGRSTAASFTYGFRQILRQGEYSAIHDHQAFVSGWHFAMGAGLLPPVRVSHIHNPTYQVQNGTLAKRVTADIGKNLMRGYATHITGTSRQVITEYGLDAPEFAHIPRMALYCGFDPMRFLGDRSGAKASLCNELGWPRESKIILFAGRIDVSPDLGHAKNHKNSGFAISVGIESARRDPQVHMALAGASSPALPVLEQRIAEAGLEGRIRFLGIRKDIERLMLASDVLLFPSRAEGLGMVAVEAQAAGLPVLASSEVPAECVVVPELVRFKDVKAGAAAWADDLLEMAAQPREIRDANQRVAASAFSIENSSLALARLYRNGARS